MLNRNPLPDVPKMVEIGGLGTVPQLGEIKPSKSFHTIPYLILLFLSAYTDQMS
jgi:hypothetical protein